MEPLLFMYILNFMSQPFHMQTTEPYVLMLEDDPDDRYLTHSIMKECDITIPVRFLSQSEGLFQVLKEAEPALIIMDFNLHAETGIEILKKIRFHEAFRHIPIVLIGDSGNASFIAECYRQGANSYAIKPTTMEATKNKIGLFFKYWLEVAELPVKRNELKTSQ
jgi:CheY-like chemotaxis protein